MYRIVGTCLSNGPYHLVVVTVQCVFLPTRQLWGRSWALLGDTSSPHHVLCTWFLVKLQ